MDIKYKIVGLDKVTGTLAINYYCDEYPEGYLCNLDLPMNPDTKTTISSDELTSLIMEHAPKQQLQWVVEKRKLASEIDFSHIENLVEPYVEPTIVSNKPE